MKGGFVKLTLVVVGLSIFFTYIGVTFLPQSESLAPEVIEIKAGISQEELLEIGEDILFGKGQCMVCHPFKPEAGMRAPSIATIGRDLIEHARQQGMPFEDYAFQALVDPGSYVLEGYAPIMPPSQKLLTEGELIAVAAFLQSKGGSVTISYPDSLPVLHGFLATGEKKKEPPSAIAKAEIKEGISQEELIMVGRKLFYDKGDCIQCHPEEPEEGMVSPSLSSLGSLVEKHARETGKDLEAFLFESMVNPEAYIVEGFDPIMLPSQESLSESELVAVGAFVQSQGGQVTLAYPESLKILKKELEKPGGQ